MMKQEIAFGTIEEYQAQSIANCLPHVPTLIHHGIRDMITILGLMLETVHPPPLWILNPKVTQ